MKAKMFCLSLALENPHQALDAYMSFVGVVWCGVGVMCLVPGRRLQARWQEMKLGGVFVKVENGDVL